MSYRSIKRVLGETSLERKCRFLFGACLLLLITASFWSYGTLTEDLVHQQNRNKGRLLVDQVMFIEHWEKLETIKTYKPLVAKLTEKLSKQEYDWRFIKPGVEGGVAMPRDEFEWKLLERWMKPRPDLIADNSRGPSPHPDAPEPESLSFSHSVHADEDAPEFDERLVLERNEYQYYQPVRVEETTCLMCHGPTPGGAGISLAGDGLPVAGGGVTGPLATGDLIAIVKVTIPYGPTQQALNMNRAILLSTAIVTVFLAMIASYVIVRYVIVKPLRHLRDVSDAISRGNISQRADIHTGDEFESLAIAFNRMLRHLVTVQDELRNVNADLDGKVDELAQVNMRLYEMNRIKSDFLATMSHELRTPLNSILGFSDVLSSIDSLSDKQKRYVQNIQKSGRMLLDMINDILDVAKLEEGKMDVQLSEFPIEQVVQVQCDLARSLTDQKNIDLDMDLSPGLPPLRQDQRKVHQILNNLLSNAIKFTPEGGRIVVGARRNERNQLELSVTDTGVGIAEDDQQIIFEKFRQARTNAPRGDVMVREYSGTGLGLSIVKELCKLLGGEVGLESELGKGSTFTVRLPWELEEQPRLDSPLDDGFEKFSRPRFEHAQEPTHVGGGSEKG